MKYKAISYLVGYIIGTDGSLSLLAGALVDEGFHFNDIKRNECNIYQITI